MAQQIKFTVGNTTSGYKSVELTILGNRIAYKILRNGLLEVAQKNSSSVEISRSQLEELDALDIFSWEENYTSDLRSGVHWSLTFTAGKKIYRGRGANAYPENWRRFLDWLDMFVPELRLVNRRRLERVSFSYDDEKLILDRNDKTLTLDKKNSSHIYDAGTRIKKIFDLCQKILDNADFADDESNFGSQVNFEIIRHDGSTENFETIYDENFLPGLANFLEEIQAVIDDLTAKIFSPETADAVSNQGKYILCKVQFPGSYKLYTYQTDDETLAVGDVVDVPVGRYNEVTQARIADIGYFEAYEAPFPIDKIKKIIGKHVVADWENSH